MPAFKRLCFILSIALLVAAACGHIAASPSEDDAGTGGAASTGGRSSAPSGGATGAGGSVGGDALAGPAIAGRGGEAGGAGGSGSGGQGRDGAAGVAPGGPSGRDGAAGSPATAPRDGALANPGVPPAASPPEIPKCAAPFLRVPGDHPTIQAAVAAAKTGDTVLVAPGTYREEIVVSGKTITLASTLCTTGDPKAVEATILQGSGNTVLTLAKDVGPETRIIGFTIQGGSDGISNRTKTQILFNRFLRNGDAIDNSGGGGIIRGNRFEENSDDGVDFDDACEGIVEYNIMINNKDDGMEMRMQPYSGPLLAIVIRHNVFVGNREDGLQLIDYPDSSSRSIRVERNVFAKSGMAGLGSMADGNTKENYAGSSAKEQVVVANNTFVDNLYGLTGSDNMLVVNNVFVRSAKLGVRKLGADSQAAHNLFWMNGADVEAANVLGGTSVMKDPQLNADYAPAAGSAAIDAGVASFLWKGATIVIAAPRSFAGAAPDLGAIEGM